VSRRNSPPALPRDHALGDWWSAYRLRGHSDGKPGYAATEVPGEIKGSTSPRLGEEDTNQGFVVLTPSRLALGG